MEDTRRLRWAFRRTIGGTHHVHITQHQRQEIARLKRLIADQAVALQVFKEELMGSSEGKNDGGSSP